MFSSWAIFFSLYWKSWLPLLGIPVSLITSFLAASMSNKRRNTVGFIVLLFGIVAIMGTGTHSLLTILDFSGFWGLTLFYMADMSQQDAVTHTMISSPELFQLAFKNGDIFLILRS